MKVRIVSNITPSIRAMSPNVKSNVDFGASQGAFLKKERTSKQFITGYNIPGNPSDDEVLEASEGSPLAEYKNIVKERIRLEKALNVSLKGGDENVYLKNFYITLKNQKDRYIELNLDNPEDLLTYRAAIANKIVAASYEDTKGATVNYLYYFETDEKSDSRASKVNKLKNSIRGKLTKFENNRVWLMAVARKLSLSVGFDSSEDYLYIKIDEYLDKEKVQASLKALDEFTNQTPKDIEFFLVMNVVKYYGMIETNEEGFKVYDGISLGQRDEEVKENLQSTKFKDVYLKLRESSFKRINIS